jgi:hypothetical protein
MPIIPTSSLKKPPCCVLCGSARVETVITAGASFVLCPDHITALAAQRLSPAEHALLMEKRQPAGGRWQNGPCAICTGPADLLFEEAEGLFAFCQPHFIRYVLLALRPDEHGQMFARLTPDEFLTRLSGK